MKKQFTMEIDLVFRNSGNEAIGTPVTIYSTSEVSQRVVVLGLTPHNLRDNPGGAQFPRLSFLTKKRKNKNEKK